MPVLKFPPKKDTPAADLLETASPNYLAPVHRLHVEDMGFRAADLSGRLQRALDAAIPSGFTTFGAVVLCLPDHDGPVRAIVLRPPVVQGGTDADLSPLLTRPWGPVYSALLGMLRKGTRLLEKGIGERFLPMQKGRT